MRNRVCVMYGTFRSWRCKKYPAVAGYFIKESCFCPKLKFKKDLLLIKIGCCAGMDKAETEIMMGLFLKLKLCSHLKCNYICDVFIMNMDTPLATSDIKSSPLDLCISKERGLFRDNSC